MKCPTCQREMQILEPFGDGEKYFVCRQHRPPVMIPTGAAPPSIVPAHMDPTDLIWDRFPTPIVMPYARSRSPELDATTRIQQVQLAFAMAIQFTALLLLRLYLSGRLWERGVSLCIARLTAPSPQRWFDLLQALTALAWPREAIERFGPLLQALVGAGRALERTRHNGQPVHLALRAFRQRFAVQGSGQPEEALERHLDTLIPLMDTALGSMAPLSKIVLVRHQGGNRILRLMGLPESLRTETTSDERLLKIMRHSPVVAVCQGRVLPLHPLLVPSENAQHGDHDEVLIFSGYGKHRVAYTGTLGRASRSDTRQAIRDLLEARAMPPIQEGRQPSQIEMVARTKAYTIRALDALTDSRFLPALYLERPGADEALGIFLSEGAESVCLVIGSSGSGRCSLLCRTAQKLLEEDRSAPLLLIESGDNLAERIIAGLGLRNVDLVQALELWRESALDGAPPKPLTVLMDLSDDHSDPEVLFDTLDQLALVAHQTNERAGVRWLTIVVTGHQDLYHTAHGRWQRGHDTPFFSHAFTMAHFNQGDGEPVPYLWIRPFNTEQAAKVYAWASHTIPRSCPTPWGQLGEVTRQVLRSPALIPVFHRAFSGVSRPDDVDEEKLWGVFFERVFGAGRHGEALSRAAMDIIERCLEEGRSSPDLDDIFAVEALWRERYSGSPGRLVSTFSPIERLELSSILRILPGRGWAFAHGELRSHLFLRALKRRNERPTAEVIQSWLEMPPSEALDNALVLAAASQWMRLGPQSISAWVRSESGRVGVLLVRALVTVAPMDGSGWESHFRAGLDELTTEADATGQNHRWKDLLLWELVEVLRADPRRTTALRHTLEVAISLLERLSLQEPENAALMRDLAVAYHGRGLLLLKYDPEGAQLWFGRSEAMAARVTAAVRSPKNEGHQAQRSYLLDLASSYSTLAPMLRSHLSALDASRTDSMRRLTDTYHRAGEQLVKTDEQRARELFEKGRVMAEQVVDMAPESASGLLDLSLAYRRMSNLDMHDDPTQARQWTEKRLSVIRRQIQQEPATLEHQRALATCFNRLGELDEGLDPEVSRRWYEKALEIRQKISEQLPDDLGILTELSNSYHRMGRIDSPVDPAKGREWFDKDRTICARLLSMEPDSLAHQRNLAIVYFRLGELDMLAAEPNRARGWFEKDVALSETLVELQPENQRLLEDLLTTYNHLLTIDAEPNPAKARSWALRGLETARKLVAMAPDDPEIHRRFVDALGHLGDLNVEYQPDVAQNWYEQHFEALGALQLLEGVSLALMREQLEACQRLGALTLTINKEDSRRWLARGIELVEAILEMPDLGREDHILMAEIYQSMADLDEGKTTEETAWLHKALGALERRLTIDPDEPRLLVQIARICDRLAELDNHPGQSDTWRQRALEIRLALIPLDADATVWDARCAQVMTAIEVYGDTDEVATLWLETLVETLEHFLGTDRKNTGHQRNLAICRLLLGDRQASNDDAQKLYNKGLARLERLSGNDDDTTEILYDLAHTYHRLVDSNRVSRPGKARDWGTLQIEAWEKLLETEPEHPGWRASMASACDQMAQLTLSNNPKQSSEWSSRALAIRDGLGQ